MQTSPKESMCVTRDWKNLYHSNNNKIMPLKEHSLAQPLPPVFILMSTGLHNNLKEYIEKVSDVGYWVTNDEMKAKTWTPESFGAFVANATNKNIVAHHHLCRNFTAVTTPEILSLSSGESPIPIFADNGKQIGTCTITFTGQSFAISGTVTEAEVLFSSQRAYNAPISLSPEGLIFTNSVRCCSYKEDLGSNCVLCTCSQQQADECAKEL